MKKWYYAFLMLAMMAMPMTFTACGDDDDEPETETPEEKTPEEETPSDPTPGKDDEIEWGFTTTYNGNTSPYDENTMEIKYNGAPPAWKESEHRLVIGFLSNPSMSELTFSFPETMSAKDFKPGYNDFTPYFKLTGLALLSMGGFSPENYKSGSATVFANDRKAIYVDFSDYTFYKEVKGSSIYESKIYQYSYSINGRVKFTIKQ